MSLTETQISQRANQVLEESGYETSEFSHNLSLRQNLEQIRYLQKQFGMKHANEIIKENVIPVYYWKIDLKEKSTRQSAIRISYDSEEEARDAIKKALSDTISLNMTMEGELVRLNVQLGEKDQIDTLSYEAAFALADSFLKKLQPDHFHSYEFIPSNNNNQFPKIEHKFAWKNNDPVHGETETINISIYGRYLNLYQDSFAIPKDMAISSSKSELKEIPVIISLITISILFIVLLIRKLRKDEIDLKIMSCLALLFRLPGSLCWFMILICNIAAEV